MKVQVNKREFVGEVMNFTGKELVKFKCPDSDDDCEVITRVTIKEIEDYLSQRDDHLVEIGDHLGIQKESGEYKFSRF